MDRRQFLHAGAVAALGLLGAPMLNLGRVRLGAAEVSTRAVDLVLESRAIDMLGLFTLDWPELFRWQRQPQTFGDAEFRRLAASGVRVFHPAVETRAKDPYAGALRWLAGWNHLLRARRCLLGRVEAPADLEALPAQGRIGVVLGFQNATHFRTALDVGTFYALGQRVCQLTYNTHNRLGSGGYEETDRGLTPFGAEVVAEMNRVGMAVDVSHCGERTSREAFEASRYPVLLTHSNCAALNPGHPRCASDEVIRRMAATGGVMGITVVRAFVGGARPGLGDVLDHFDHVARLVGVEHVGLGSDVDVTGLDAKTGRVRSFYAIRGLDPATRTFQIADGLLQRGWGAEATALALGGNFRRALGAIWHREARRVPSARELRRDPFCPLPRPAAPG
jgi:membrane dipeptidase